MCGKTFEQLEREEQARREREEQERNERAARETQAELGRISSDVDALLSRVPIGALGRV